MKAQIFIDEIIWNYCGIRWAKEAGAVGRVTFKWPALAVVGALLLLAGFLAG